MALVSKSWYEVVNELVARYQRDTMQLTFNFGSRAEILAIRQQVQLRGRAVRDLRIRMEHSDGTHFVAGIWWWMEDREISWDVIFSQLPGLKRLDLSLVPLESHHLPILLDLAAKFCLQLEMLILPRKCDVSKMVNGAAIEKVMKALRGAMQRWHRKGTCGGLTQLTVPTREEQDRCHSSTRFIEDVIQFCPNIEYLDGYNHVIDEVDDVTCEEQWMISLDTWEKFNRICTSLRVFHWAVVPFADPFFRVFGEYVKPKLTKLTLTSNLSWNWDEYFERDDITGIRFEEPGYGFLANDVIALLKGCPALTKLEIAIDQEKNDEAAAALLDPNIFGDKFWKALVYHCPLLQSLNFHDSSAYGGSLVVRPIQKFTDRGLLALATHTHLTSIELPAVCCSGDGVFEYIKHVFSKKDFAGGHRCLALSLAGPNDHDTALPHLFYVELAQLLGRLAATREVELGVASCSHKASINVFNPHSSSVDKDWSISYLRDELKPLMEKVAKAHPTLDVHVVLCRNTEDSFDQIDNLELNWCPGSQQGEIFIDDEFVGNADSSDSDEDDEEFYDDEDILDPHEIYLRRHAMLLENEYDVFPDEVDEN
ncbi:unnamed protein product [Peronospora effusa]|nr:unnamed protein product [Peronospora effusa]